MGDCVNQAIVYTSSVGSLFRVSREVFCAENEGDARTVGRKKLKHYIEHFYPNLNVEAKLKEVECFLEVVPFNGIECFLVQENGDTFLI